MNFDLECIIVSEHARTLIELLFSFPVCAMRLVSKSLPVQSLTEETVGADLATKHTSVHFSSSNNPAGPDFNQNLNLTWPDVFPMSPCTSGPCSSNYFRCLPLLDSLLKFISCLPCLNCASNPASWSFQYLVSPISSFQNLVHTSVISFFEPISPQTASHVLIAPTAISPTLSCTAYNFITIKIMAQCRNAELRTRSIILMKLT